MRPPSAPCPPLPTLLLQRSLYQPTATQSPVPAFAPGSPQLRPPPLSLLPNMRPRIILRWYDAHIGEQTAPGTSARTLPKSPTSNAPVSAGSVPATTTPALSTTQEAATHHSLVSVVANLRCETSWDHQYHSSPLLKQTNHRPIREPIRDRSRSRSREIAKKTFFRDFRRDFTATPSTTSDHPSTPFQPRAGWFPHKNFE